MSRSGRMGWAVVGVAALLGAAIVVVALQLMAAPPSLPSAVAGNQVPPLAGSPLVRVAVAGDSGTADAAEERTAAVVDAQEPDREYDGLLLLGDLVYEDGDPARVEVAVTGPFADVLDGGTQIVPVLGNHDVQRGQQDQILRQLGRTASWYEQRLGPLRVVVLDSTRADDPAQTAWLEQVLGVHSTGSDWTVVAMHHPPYSAGYHGADADVLAMRARWAPIFARYRVPLVLAGHDHDYQRSTPQDGVTYVVSGAAARLRPAGVGLFTAVSTSTRHFVDLLAYQDRLELRAIDQDGRLVDALTLVR